MPYLLLVAGLDAGQAVVTSLVIQVAGMGSGAVAIIRAGKADTRLSVYLSAAAFPGIPVGVWLSHEIAPERLVFLLGVFSLSMALVFVYTQEDVAAVDPQPVTLRRTAPYLCLSSAFAVLTGLLSMGVGDFLVPILRNRLRLSMEAAMSACLVVMAASAAFAAILHCLSGETFARGVVTWAVPGVILGGQIGPRLAGRISDRTLKEIFIYALALAGIHLIFNIPTGP